MRHSSSPRFCVGSPYPNEVTLTRRTTYVEWPAVHAPFAPTCVATSRTFYTSTSHMPAVAAAQPREVLRLVDAGRSGDRQRELCSGWPGANESRASGFRRVPISS
eukprot:2211012-Pleurochrysis_carterae.AAC.1